MCAMSVKAVRHHPAIYLYLLKSGARRYAAVATYQGRQKWTRGHKTIPAAEEAKTAALAFLRRGLMPDFSPKLTLAQFLALHWLPSVDVTQGSLRNYKVAAQNVVAFLAARESPDLRLSDVSAAHLEQFKIWMRNRGLAPNTRNRTFNRLAQALSHARRLKLIPANPCDDVKPPAKGKYEPPPMGLEDLGRLLQAAYKTPHGFTVYLPVVTGLRESELFGAMWPNLDVAAGTLAIIGKGNKTRVVVIDPATLELLRQHRLEQMRRFASPDENGEPDPKLMPQRIFTNPDGRAWTQQNFYARWDAIRKAAGIPTLHFHDLRHLHSTLGSKAGVPVKVMQKRLGHEDAALTLNIYTHADVEDQRPAAAAITSLVGTVFQPQ